MGEAPRGQQVERVEGLALALRQLVQQGYQPSEAVERMRALLAGGSACFRRDHFEPGHFTASAFVLDASHSRLLLIHHAKLGLWLQPGGHVEPADVDLLAAARRELAEEVGLEQVELLIDGIFDVDIHRIPAGRDPAHQHFDVRFLFASAQHQLRPGSDALAARWVALGDVSSQNSDESVMRAVRRIERWVKR